MPIRFDLTHPFKGRKCIDDECEPLRCHFFHGELEFVITPLESWFIGPEASFRLYQDSTRRLVWAFPTCLVTQIQGFPAQYPIEVKQAIKGTYAFNATAPRKLVYASTYPAAAAAALAASAAAHPTENVSEESKEEVHSTPSGASQPTRCNGCLKTFSGAVQRVVMIPCLCSRCESCFSQHEYQDCPDCKKSIETAYVQTS